MGDLLVEEAKRKLAMDRRRYVFRTPEQYPLAASSLTVLEGEALVERVEQAEAAIEGFLLNEYPEGVPPNSHAAHLSKALAAHPPEEKAS